MKKIITVTLLIFFLVGGVSEAVNLKKGIIGKWFEVEGKWGLEFLKDGTVIRIGYGKSEIGSYIFIDDNRLKLGIEGQVEVFEVSIDKEGQMIFTNPMGEISKFITKVEKEKKLKEKFVFSDLTVLDNETKLIWIRNANIAGKKMKWDDTFKFIESLNQQKYAGYSDWRLPSKEELETLVNFAKGQGYTKNINEFFNKLGFKMCRQISIGRLQRVRVLRAMRGTSIWIISVWASMWSLATSYLSCLYVLGSEKNHLTDESRR